jgi:arabinoxylan arabinofuranohydrolase
MKKIRLTLNRNYMVLLLLLPLLSLKEARGNDNQPERIPPEDRFVHQGAGNPYLPLWEHLPDGEPRVFEDPDNPGKYRAYIIGSHDVRFTSYCGPDIRMWSAPVEDLSSLAGRRSDFHPLC